MISKYKTYLEKKLKEAGVKGKIYKSGKELKASGAVNVGAIIFEEEKFEKDGSKKKYIKKDGTKVKRTRKFIRKTKLSVIIGDYTEEKVEETFSKFLSIIDTGLDDGNGNYVEINVLDSDWVDKNDSILKSNMAVQVLIEFVGGIYKDIEFIKVNEVEIIDVEIEKRSD